MLQKKHLKWTAIIGIFLMLFAISLYVLTLDDSSPNVLPTVVKEIEQGKK